MNVKEAINHAKTHARDVFDNENLTNLGVEEVRNIDGAWRITLGLSRPWDNLSSGLAALSALNQPANRSYHVFTVSDEDGRLIDVKLRDR